MELIKDGKTIVLNEQQEEGVNKIQAFLKSKDLFFTLSGPAGTGKTTICLAAIKGYYNVGVSAPTHQAKAEIENATGISGTTIQSVLGLKPATDLEEFSQRNTLFRMGSGEKMGDYSLLVIDESSMINKDLYLAIKEFATFHGTKILFMGDSNQLPPVGETIGMVFADESIPKHFLTVVERQTFGNPLIEIYGKILSDIESPVDVYEKKSNVTELKEGYTFYDAPMDFVESIKSYFSFPMTEKNKVIAWTNENVRKWNRLIRKSIPELNGTLVVIGESLKAHRTVFSEEVKKAVVIQNSSDYIVESYKDFTTVIGKEPYQGLLVRIYNEIMPYVKRDIFVPTEQNSLRMFIEEEQRLSSKAKTEKNASERAQLWARYYQYRNKFFIIGDILYPNTETVMVAKDLDYNYAITVHKSQGSTFANVFVDMNNIDKFWDPKMNPSEINATRNRLKYVALSRPRKSAHIFQY
jgi:exodeoxyribonuclease-5